jgi:hypothetical protein
MLFRQFYTFIESQCKRDGLIPVIEIDEETFLIEFQVRRLLAHKAL